MPQTRQWALTSLVPVMQDWGFHVDPEPSTHIVLERRRSQWPIAFFSVIAYLLTPSQTDRVIIVISPAADGLTQMSVIGDVPRKIAAVLKGLPSANP